MKALLFSLMLIPVIGGISFAGDPLIGHWTFQQFTTYVNNPGAPMLCIGDLEIHKDGTYEGWNICKHGNSPDRFEMSWSGDWRKVSPRHYMANGGDYDIVLSRDGKSGFFGSTRTTNPDMNGVYEWGTLLKVRIDRNGLQ